MSRVELKPCSVCKGKPVLRVSDDVFLTSHKRGYAYVCSNCGLATPASEDNATAFDAWQELKFNSCEVEKMKKKVRIVRPCPNCGSKKITSFKTVFPKKLRKWHLECEKCHYCGKKAVFRFTAEIKWNKEKRNAEVSKI